MAKANRITELESRLAELEAEKAAIDAQIADVYGELIQTRNAAVRNKTLTPAMREALGWLAAGAVIKESTFKHPYRTWLEIDGQSKDIRRSIFDGLLERETIERNRNLESVMIRAYQITEHGRMAVQPA